MKLKRLINIFRLVYGVRMYIGCAGSGATCGVVNAHPFKGVYRCLEVGVFSGKLTVHGLEVLSS